MDRNPAIPKEKLIINNEPFISDILDEIENYVEHVENYCPINYCELKFNKPCESVTIERWGDYDEKYGVVCRSNGKVIARYTY